MCCVNISIESTGHCLLLFLLLLKSPVVIFVVFSQADCPNFIRVLQFLNTSHIYACGTFAFSPRCTYIVRVVTQTFKLMGLFDLLTVWECSLFTELMSADFFLFTVQNSEMLTMSVKPDEGRGRCPYDPYQRNTAIIVGKVMSPHLLHIAL